LKGYWARHTLADDYGVIFTDAGSGTMVEIPDVMIDGLVGSGANGIVFSATDALGRELAVKVYPPRIDRDRDIDDTHEQAISEARKIASLKHGGLATVYKYGRLGDEYRSFGWSSDGWPYCVMEYCPGQPLKDVIADMKDDLEGRRSALLQIFDVLAYAEDRGALHGDLHAGNILIETWRSTGNVSVIDFGTSVFAGKEPSEARHSRLLLNLTYRLLPELREAFVPTPRLVSRTGAHMLPRLVAALKLYDQMNPSPQFPAKLAPSEVGAELAYATDFDLDILWTVLKPCLDESKIPEIKKAVVEYLTHEHELAGIHLSDAQLATRLRQELESRKIETRAILAEG
jgi:tRNA A-37 threonylcarbamoyl transferase component Bud32